VKALYSEALTLRSDSKLCKAYIDGSNVKSIDEIVIVMKKMAVIHERLERWLPDMRRVAISDYNLMISTRCCFLNGLSMLTKIILILGVR